MNILDKIRGKKEQDKSSKQENVLELVKEPLKADEKKEVVAKDDTGRAYHVLNSIHISEKTNALASINRYVFKVNAKANKIEVKKAVEKAFDVHVVAVNVVNVKGKMRRIGRKSGFTSDWKKAVVTLKPGEKISGLVQGV